MRIPKKIKIASHDIKIRRKKKSDDSLLAFGYADLAHNEIVLFREFGGKPLEESTVTETFLHEIIHQVAQLYGISLKEREVNQLAAGLLQVIRGNKINFLDTTC